MYLRDEPKMLLLLFLLWLCQVLTGLGKLAYCYTLNILLHHIEELKIEICLNIAKKYKIILCSPKSYAIECIRELCLYHELQTTRLHPAVLCCRLHILQLNLKPDINISF